MLALDQVAAASAPLPPLNHQARAHTDLITPSIHNLHKRALFSCHRCTFNLVTVVITSCVTIKNVCTKKTQAPKLKVITEAFLGTLPLRSSPSSQEAFSSSVNPLTNGPPLSLSSRWLRCKRRALLSKSSRSTAFTSSHNLLLSHT